MTAPVRFIKDVFEDEDERPPEFSDDSLALIFADRHSDDLKFVAAANEWRQWTGTYWKTEKTLAAFDLAREVCRSAAARAGHRDEKRYARIAANVASAKTVAAVERMARADRRIAREIEGWDADPWLLNTPRGAVDLRQGYVRKNVREDFCTKITGVPAAERGTECPRWIRFLERVTGGDFEMQAYLQRVIGYCLTGSVREHAMFFLFGTGRNGKGVFISILRAMMGAYAENATMEAFMVAPGSQHTTDLAMLNGARFVSAQETEEGRGWAESKIKSITGGDSITARKMRQDNVTFDPTFKIVMAGNHKPSLRNVDEAIRARLNLIPFTVTIPETERDPELVEKLKEELPAILSWAIEGCLQWQEQGLNPPASVRDATAEYLAEEDSFSLWLSESCDEDADSFETSADLFASWKAWAEKAGEPVGKQKGFAQNLKARGYAPHRQGGTGRMGFCGLSIKRPDYTDDSRYGA